MPSVSLPTMLTMSSKSGKISSGGGGSSTTTSSVTHSVIQSTSQQSLLVPTGDEGQYTQSEAKRRRELYRRPSYRKILNELAESPPNKDDEQDNEDSDKEEGKPTAAAGVTLISLNPFDPQNPTNIRTFPSQSLQIMTGDMGSQAGYQAVTLTNASPSLMSYLPQGNGLTSNSLGGIYQVKSPGGGQTGGLALSPTSSLSDCSDRGHKVGEEQSRKRELRLLKNREAARECRRKKKEYIKCLENRVAVLENQNKTLVEELKALKEIYCRATGGSEGE